MPDQTEPVTTPPQDACTQATWFLDADHPRVAEYAARVASDSGARTPRERAVALFYAVRDGWRYDPYRLRFDADSFRAGTVLDAGPNWCVPKSVLLTALCRAQGIPAGIGFADVRNHLQSAGLRERMGTDLFVYHGYSVLWLGDRWLKASPAFNRELCERFGTRTLEFDGYTDALMHPYDVSGNRHMEYVAYHGDYTDLPFEQVVSALRAAYGTAFDGVAAERDSAFHG